jgi:hypothetical protein
MPNGSIKRHNVSEMHHMNSALGTAPYILRSLNEGQRRYEIVQHMDNNEKLVTVWIQYLKAIDWLKEVNPGNCLATENGKLWIQRYEKVISSNFNTNLLANILNKQRS